MHGGHVDDLAPNSKLDVDVWKFCYPPWLKSTEFAIRGDLWLGWPQSRLMEDARVGANMNIIILGSQKTTYKHGVQPSLSEGSN